MDYLEEPDRQEDDLVGKVLCGKWRILHRIGRGGMSTVYAAVHRNGRKVAVKVLRKSFAGNRRIVTRFLREGYVANKIRHPGAVAILDDDVDTAGTVFHVMELLDGATLAERYGRSEKTAPLGEVLRVGERLLDVLVPAHESGIVHRDIKPSNVFLTTDGAVMLLDFGIARLLEAEGETGATHSGATLGTPGFMAPEQARGRGNMVDMRTDIWAVGALLFFLLTGRTVHEAETPNEHLIASATQPARSVSSFCVELPNAVAALVDRALDMDRDRRWPDAKTMKDALVAARAELPETVLSQSAVRAAGIGGSSTLPEPHTAEPSVLSHREVRGVTPRAADSSGVRPTNGVVWAFAIAALAIGTGTALVLRPFGAERRPNDVSTAGAAPSATSLLVASTGAPMTMSPVTVTAPPPLEPAPPESTSGERLEPPSAHLSDAPSKKQIARQQGRKAADERGPNPAEGVNRPAPSQPAHAA
jgi:serine/threonine protein kinase